MLTSEVVTCGIDMLLVVFAVYLFFYYFDIFFARKKDKVSSIVGLAVFIIWQFGMSSISMLPGYVNIGITIIVTLFTFMTTYEGKWLDKCVFVIAFNAIWMLMETLCNYILLIYSKQYAMNQQLGSLISKSFFLMFMIALKKVFMDEEIKELPVKYGIMLVLIPTGSIYIMNNIFMLGYKVNTERAFFNSAITSIILLGMNILIFYIYIKLADDLRLRRMTSVYEKQLELCERHQQETEISTLQLRDVSHNMKNNLISILAYAESGEYEKIIGFVNEVMEEGGMTVSTIINSGNIVIDSLIGYWYMTAKKKKIDFTVKISIPMKIAFKGADICLILGNLLENAVEAAQKVDGKKYIKIQMKYDKNNLLIFVVNNYKGKLIKTKDNRLKSTKSDAGNHGVGLSSVYRVAAKYHGTVVVDDSVPERFLIRVVLYGEQK